MEVNAAPASNNHEHGSNKRQRTVAPQGATPDITEEDSRWFTVQAFLFSDSFGN